MFGNGLPEVDGGIRNLSRIKLHPNELISELPGRANIWTGR